MSSLRRMPFSTHQSRRQRLLWLNLGLLALGVAVVCGLWLMVLGTLAAERRQALAAASVQLQGLAQAYEAYTQQLLQRVDLVTRLAAREAAAPGGLDGAMDLLRSGLDHQPSLLAGYILDPQGRVLATTRGQRGLDLGDRAHFRVHRDGAGGGLYVGRPVQGRVTGRWVVPLSRRIERKDGGFGGVVVVAADPSHFTGFYNEAQLGPRGLTLLAASDGSVLARRAGTQVWYGNGDTRQPLAESLGERREGVLQGDSPFDGEHRLLAYRSVAGRSLVVAVGQAEADVLAPAREREHTLRLFAAGTSVVLVLVFGGLALLLRRWRLSQAQADALQVQFHAASEASLDAFFILKAVRDAQSRVVDFAYVHANERGARLLRLPVEQLVGRRRSEVPMAAGDPRFFELYCRVLDTGIPAEEVLQVHPPDGPWMQHQVVPLGDGVVLSSRDVSAQRQREQDILAAQQALADSEQRLRAITDNLPVLITYIDRDERVSFANQTARDWYGLGTERVIGMPLRDLVGEGPYEARRGPLQRALAGARVQFELEGEWRGRPRHLQSTYVPDIRPDGSIAGVYGLSADVTELKQVQARLVEMAHLDPVTGLANRNRFDELLPLALKRADRQRSPLALLFLDLDHFKAVNDRHGHAAGDAVLREFGRRLVAAVRATDTVARLAGDEFVVLLEGLGGSEDAEQVAAKIVEQVQEPMVVDGVELHVSTSIGIALHLHGTALAPATLLRRADEALYEAKAAGRNAWRMKVV
jgi:diguanylate cyclase (GGDEF)-like protein/PAS domain S-box-containing protein